MQTGICHIVGAGENYGINFEPGTKDLVIAVDAGFRLLEQKAVRIDLAIGDFDTLQYIPKHSNVIALKAEKDDTDMLAAVREGIRAGYSLFHIYCGTGGRLDHTLANLQVAAALSQEGRQGFVVDRDCRKGELYLCEKRDFAGFHAQGVFAVGYTVDEELGSSRSQ